MSCYTRHLGELFPAGPRPEARRRLDAAVRSVVGLPDADCPDVWAAVKRGLEADSDFGQRVHARLAAGDTVLRGTLPSRTLASGSVSVPTRRPLSPDVPLRTAPPASGGPA